jgi:protocatechuate 3,4-dioxygenase beta subunit
VGAGAPRATAAAACVLSPEVTAGPYYIANHLTRRNITENRPGLPLLLYLTVVEATTCKPIEGADVEVWHADATGAYSGYSASTPPSGGGGHATPNNDKTFLRGHQKSDAEGRVRFDTIYPGWYRGRAPHIHLKVHVGGSVVHTGQVFFSDALSDAVYRTSAYRSHGEPDTTNGADNIYAAAGGSSARLKLTRRAGAGKGFRGAITVGVRT